MRRFVVLGTVTMLLVAGCAGGDDGGTAAPEDAAAAAGEEERVQRATSPVTWHTQSGREGEVEDATASLETTGSGATARLEATELEPGNAYTLWFVIVNAPEGCAEHPEPCEASDVLGNPGTESQVAFGDGTVADEDGEATFVASFDAGPVPGGWYEDRGFTDPLGAEIHLTLNDHGPALDEYMPAMVETYRAGCTEDSLVEAFPDSAKEDGEPGPNTCRLWQSVIFQQ